MMFTVMFSTWFTSQGLAGRRKGPGVQYSANSVTFLSMQAAIIVHCVRVVV